MAAKVQLRLCREGWGYLVIMGFVLAGALLRQMNLLVIVVGLLTGPLVASLRWPRLQLSRLQLRRRFPHSITAGDLLVVEVELSRTHRMLPAWAIQVTDALAMPNGITLEVPLLFSALPAGTARNIRYSGRLPFRGAHTVGPAVLSTRFPFGLVRGRLALTHHERLLVLPRLGRLQPAWRRWQQAASAGAGAQHHRRALMAGEFHGLREWRPGDNRRWIHWRTTARKQRPVVRQFEIEQPQDLLVVVELWQPTEPRDTERDSVELAISLAATIVADASRGHVGRLTLAIAAASSLTFSGAPGRGLAAEMLEALALAKASPAPNLSDTLAASLTSLAPGTRLAILSTRPVDLSASASLFDAKLAARFHGPLSRALQVDASSPRLAEYFEVEP